MPQFNVTLARSFSVLINAKNESQAKRLAELFLGYHDESTLAYQRQFRFQIAEIEMTLNEAVDAEEVPMEE